MAKKIEAPTSESVTATEAVLRFGELIDKARVRPVTVMKHGRPAFVAVSASQYQKLLDAFIEKHKLEDV